MLTFVLAIEMRVHCGLRLSIARASSALHSSCTAVALSMRERRRVAHGETACYYQRDGVLLKETQGDDIRRQNQSPGREKAAMASISLSCRTAKWPAYPVSCSVNRMGCRCHYKKVFRRHENRSKNNTGVYHGTPAKRDICVWQ